jgi:RNA polymerase sigma factor (sigma-70 family)
VTHARNGNQQAWDALVERYAPLIWSICRRYRLCGADANDVGESVWLYLVDQLDRIRDPAALPGWLATTTRRECGRVLRAAQILVAYSEVRGIHLTGLAQLRGLLWERPIWPT